MFNFFTIFFALLTLILVGCGSTSPDLQVTEESQEVEKQLYEEKRLEAILAALDAAAAAKVPEPVPSAVETESKAQPKQNTSKETNALFQWKTSSGYDWINFGDAESQPKYEGERKKGNPDGLGMLYYPDGQRVEGQWKDGKNWNAKHYNKDGKVIGKWVNGHWDLQWGVLFKRSVNGELGWYENYGEQGQYGKYEGGIKNGQPDGHGKYISPKGSMFEGEYRDGKRNGQGKYINYDGIIWVGEFREGNLWNVTRYDKDGNIKWKIVNGVKQ